MKFILEDIGDRFSELKNEIDQTGSWYKEIKFIPFSMTFDIALPDQNYADYFPFSSVNTMLLAKKLGMNVFFTDGKYDYTRFAQEYGPDFINPDLTVIKFKSLLDLKGPDIYIRDAYGDNIIKGKVLEGEQEYQMAYGQFMNRSMGDKKITDDYPIIISTPKNIVREYRFFVVNNEVITGSMYQESGQYFIKNIDSFDYFSVSLFVEKMIERYSPDKSFVIDIAEMKDGSFKVVECNCINCSGFYSIDIRQVIRELING